MIGMDQQIKERCIYCGADVYYTGTESLIKCGMCGHTLVVAKFENELARMHSALEAGEQASRELEEVKKEKQTADNRLFAALSSLNDIRDDQDTIGKLLHVILESQTEAGQQLTTLQETSQLLMKAQGDVFEKMNVMQSISEQLLKIDMDGQARQSLMNDFMAWTQNVHEEDIRRLQVISKESEELLEVEKEISGKLDSLQNASDRHQKTIDSFHKQYSEDKLLELRQIYRQAENDQFDWRFDKADEGYRQVIVKGAGDAEVLWRRLLCHYCIAYQQDEYDNLIPIILNPDLSDPDEMSVRLEFLAALENEQLPEEQKEVYLTQLAGIDRILDKYREVRHNVAYDVFISVKQKRSGRYTKDSDVASDLYDFLVGKGLKVFNSRRTIIPAGQEYEPYIIAALMSAKTLIVVGSSQQNMNAQWVKNEWSRFGWLQKREKEKFGKSSRNLICYLTGGMEPKQIPKALNPDKQAIRDGLKAHDELVLALDLDPASVPEGKTVEPEAALPPKAEKPKPEIKSLRPKAVAPKPEPKPFPWKYVWAGVLVAAILLFVVVFVIYRPLPGQKNGDSSTAIAESEAQTVSNTIGTVTSGTLTVGLDSARINDNEAEDEFDAALAELLADELGLELKRHTTPVGNHANVLAGGVADIVIGCTGEAESGEIFLPSEGYMYSGPFIMLNPDLYPDGFAGKDYLEGMKIGILSGYDQLYTAINEFDNVYYDDIVAMIADMMTGAIDGIWISDAYYDSVPAACEKAGFDFASLDIGSYYDSRRYISVSKDNNALTEEITEILSGSSVQNKIEELAIQYFGTTEVLVD